MIIGAVLEGVSIAVISALVLVALSAAGRRVLRWWSQRPRKNGPQVF